MFFRKYSLSLCQINVIIENEGDILFSMMRIVLKVVGSCLSVVVVLMLATMLLLSTDGVQNRLIQYAGGILKKQLETELSI